MSAPRPRPPTPGMASGPRGPPRPGPLPPQARPTPAIINETATSTAERIHQTLTPSPAVTSGPRPMAPPAPTGPSLPARPPQAVMQPGHVLPRPSAAAPSPSAAPSSPLPSVALPIPGRPVLPRPNAAAPASVSLPASPLAGPPVPGPALPRANASPAPATSVTAATQSRDTNVAAAWGISERPTQGVVASTSKPAELATSTGSSRKLVVQTDAGARDASVPQAHGLSNPDNTNVAASNLMPVYDLQGKPLGFFPLAPGITLPTMPTVGPLGSMRGTQTHFPMAHLSGRLGPSDTGSDLSKLHASSPVLHAKSPDRKGSTRPTQDHHVINATVEPTPKVEVVANGTSVAAYALQPDPAHMKVENLPIRGPAAAQPPSASPDVVLALEQDIVLRETKIRELESEMKRKHNEALSMQENLERAINLLQAKEAELGSLKKLELARTRRPLLLSALTGAGLAQQQVPFSSVLEEDLQIALLRRVPLLMQLPDCALRQLMAAASISVVSAGALLSRASSLHGDPGIRKSDTSLIILLDGSAKPVPGSSVLPETVAGPGAWFGEPSILLYDTGLPHRRATNWTAVTDTLLLEIPSGLIRRFLLSEAAVVNRWSLDELALLMSATYTPLQPPNRLTVSSGPQYTSLLRSCQQYRALLLVAQGQHIVEAKRLDGKDMERRGDYQPAARGLFFDSATESIQHQSGISHMSQAYALVPPHLSVSAAIGLHLLRSFSPAAGAYDVIESLADGLSAYFGAYGCIVLEPTSFLPLDRVATADISWSVVAATTQFVRLTGRGVAANDSMSQSSRSNKPVRRVVDTKESHKHAHDAHYSFEWLPTHNNTHALLTVPVHAILEREGQPATPHLVGLVHIVDKMHDTRRMAAKHASPIDMDDAALHSMTLREKEGSRICIGDDGLQRFSFSSQDEAVAMLAARRIGDVLTQAVRQVWQTVGLKPTGGMRSTLRAGHEAYDALQLNECSLVSQMKEELANLASGLLSRPEAVAIPGIGDGSSAPGLQHATSSTCPAPIVPPPHKRLTALHTLQDALQMRVQTLFCSEGSLFKSSRAGAESKPAAMSSAVYVTAKAWISYGEEHLTTPIVSDAAHVTFGAQTGIIDVPHSSIPAVARWQYPTSGLADGAMPSLWSTEKDHGRGWCDFDIRVSHLPRGACIIVEVHIDQDDDSADDEEDDGIQRKSDPRVLIGSMPLFTDNGRLRTGRLIIPLASCFRGANAAGAAGRNNNIGQMTIDLGSVCIPSNTVVVDCDLSRAPLLWHAAAKFCNIVGAEGNIKDSLAYFAENDNIGMLQAALHDSLAEQAPTWRMSSASQHRAGAIAPQLRGVGKTSSQLADIAATRTALSRLDAMLFDRLIQGAIVADMHTPVSLSASFAFAVWKERFSVSAACGAYALPIIWRSGLQLCTLDADEHLTTRALAAQFRRLVRAVYPLPPSVCLQLLSPQVADASVRNLVVKSLSNLTSERLVAMLPELIPAILCEQSLDSGLARFLLCASIEYNSVARVLAWSLRALLPYSQLAHQLLLCLLDVSEETFTPELALHCYANTQLAVACRRVAACPPQHQTSYFRALMSTLLFPRVFRLPVNALRPILPSVYFRALQDGRLVRSLILFLDGGFTKAAMVALADDKSADHFKDSGSNVEDVDAFQQACAFLQEIEDACAFALGPLGLFSDAAALAINPKLAKDYRTLVTKLRSSQDTSVKLAALDHRLPQASAEEFWCCSRGPDGAKMLDAHIPFPAAVLRAARDAAAAKANNTPHAACGDLAKQFADFVGNLSHRAARTDATTEQREAVHNILQAVPQHFLAPEMVGLGFPSGCFALSEVLADRCRVLCEDKRRRLVRCLVAGRVANEAFLQEAVARRGTHHNLATSGADPFPEVVKLAEPGLRPMRFRDNIAHFVCAIEDATHAFLDQQHAIIANTASEIWRNCGLEIGDFTLPYISGAHLVSGRDPVWPDAEVPKFVAEEGSLPQCDQRAAYMYMQLCAPDVQTLEEILAFGDTRKVEFGRNALQRWLMSSVFSDATAGDAGTNAGSSEAGTAYDLLVKSFMFSLAGTAVLAYLFALGTLEPNNLLISPSGHIALTSLHFAEGRPEPSLMHDATDASTFMKHVTGRTELLDGSDAVRLSTPQVLAELYSVLGIHLPLSAEAHLVIDSLVSKCVEAALALRARISEVSGLLSSGIVLGLPGMAKPSDISAYRSRLFVHASDDVARAGLTRIFKQFLFVDSGAAAPSFTVTTTPGFGTGGDPATLRTQRGEFAASPALVAQSQSQARAASSGVASRRGDIMLLAVPPLR